MQPVKVRNIRLPAEQRGAQKIASASAINDLNALPAPQRFHQQRLIGILGIDGQVDNAECARRSLRSSRNARLHFGINDR